MIAPLSYAEEMVLKRGKPYLHQGLMTDATFQYDDKRIWIEGRTDGWRNGRTDGGRDGRERWLVVDQARLSVASGSVQVFMSAHVLWMSLEDKKNIWKRRYCMQWSYFVSFYGLFFCIKYKYASEVFFLVLLIKIRISCVYPLYNVYPLHILFWLTIAQTYLSGMRLKLTEQWAIEHMAGRSVCRSIWWP